MITTNQLHWAAGFTDGEGSFYNSGHYTPAIRVGQNEKELLDRLASSFGGTPRIEKRKYKGLPNDIWIWQINGKKAVGLMMTLYPLLSTKRQQKIKSIIAEWRNNSRLRNPMFWKQSVCKKGHDLMVGSPNVRIDNHGHRTCWICIRANWRRQYKHKRLKLAA